MLEALSAGLSVLTPETGSTREFVRDIRHHGGEPFVTYVRSEVVVDQGASMNKIAVDDLVSTLLQNEGKFKAAREHDASAMRIFIEAEYSWSRVSELLLRYFAEMAG